MNPRVKQVSVSSDYKLFLVFTNGEQGIYDCSNLLQFGVFKEFRNMAYFKQAKVIDGTVAWPHEQDICPDTLYLDSIKEKPANCCRKWLKSKAAQQVAQADAAR